MQNWRRRGIGTPAGWYTLVGIVMLGVSIWVPFLTAARTARVELRADRIASLLLEASLTVAGPIGDDDVDFVLARFHALALRDGVHTADLERVEPPLADTLLTLENKHYAFHLAVSPPHATAVPGEGTDPAYEVMAWPREKVGPAHTAFFDPDDAPPAFTRNLNRNYHGFGAERPSPGRSHRHPSNVVDTRAFYRSIDDERWIVP